MSNSGENQIRIVQSGPMTLIQDEGRNGYQQLGVSVSGAVDIDSLAIGNRLVGNNKSSAGLEVLLGGLTLEFSSKTVFAITGADSSPHLDGVAVPMNVSCVAHPGARLELGMVSSGLRSYVAVAGGVAVAELLGSRSTHIASELGGIDGRPVDEGDVFELGTPNVEELSGLILEDQIVPSGELTVRVILGPQDNEFSVSGIDTLLGSSYVVTDQSNRQGLRLDGPEIESASGRYDIISDAVVNGSIQIPGDGKPIILLADRQTTGGYAKIATVASVDLSILGQASPGTIIRFVGISVEEAQSLLLSREQRIYETELIDVVDSLTVQVDGLDVRAGVAENGSVKLANIEGSIYPISVDEYSPAE